MSVNFKKSSHFEDSENYEEMSSRLLSHFDYTRDTNLLDIEYIEHESYIKECDYCGKLLRSKKMGNNARTLTNRYVDKDAEYPSTDDCCKACLGKKNKMTWFLKHGVMYNLGALETRARNGKVPTSRQQIYLASLMNADLNTYFKDVGFVDIVLEDRKIIIEYDGSGHYLGTEFGTYTYEEKIQADYERDLSLRELGYKVIRIESKYDYLPMDEVILKKIKEIENLLDTSGKEFFKWIIPSSKKDKTDGALRVITEDDLSR